MSALTTSSRIETRRTSRVIQHGKFEPWSAKEGRDTENQSLSSVLLISLLALAFLGLLKVADAFRDLSFEIRQARAALEHQMTRMEQIHQEWWSWNQPELADRAKESRRRTTPTLDQIMQDVG
jgi:hypothetical protein